MSAHSPLDSHSVILVFTLMSTLAVIFGTGTMLMTGIRTNASPWTRRAVEFASGLVFITSITATIVLGRVCYLTVLPLIQLGFMAYQVRQGHQACVRGAADPHRWTRDEIHSVAGLALGTLAFTSWHQGWLLAGGELRSFHSDLGYFIQMVEQLPEARIANGWTAVLGDRLRELPGQHDVWYHWGPMWLAVAVKTWLRDLPAIEALLIIAGSALNFGLLLATSAVVQTLCKTSRWRSLAVAAASLVAVQWLRAYGLLWIASWFPYGVVQHLRWTLTTMFSYKFEGVLVLTTLAAWLERRTLLAVLLLFCAGVSAPHTVGALGAMAGTLGLIGLVLKRPALWKTAGTIIAVLLTAWAMVTLVFGCGMPKAEGQHLLSLDIENLRRSLRAAMIDSGIGLLVGALSLPGILHLIRSRDERTTEESRTLGWIALSALLGSYAAYSFLHAMVDRFHFITLAQALLVLPAGVWGAARMAWWTHTPWLRWCGVALIVVTTGMGVHDVIWLRATDTRLPCTQSNVRAIRQVLQGRPFGFFSDNDRQWWIPKHTVIASLLESRCVRLNEIESKDAYSRYYGADLIHQLVPREPGESSSAWSLRLAARLGVKHVLELPSDPLPAAMKPFVKQVAQAGDLRLFEILTP